jgi:HK97 family phage prohead protease
MSATERPRLVKSIALPIKDLDEKKGIITGLFAHFGSLDKHGDIIQPKAFKKTILENGPQGTNEIAHLLDHTSNQAVAAIQVLEESKEHNGLLYESFIGTHSLGKDFTQMVLSGLIKFHSIGYQTMKEFYDPQQKANILTELKLYEGSSLQFIAANHNTPVLGLKSDQDILEYFDIVQRFIRTSTATDETLKSLEEKLKSLSDYIAGMTTIEEKKADDKQINELLKFNFEKWKIS